MKAFFRAPHYMCAIIKTLYLVMFTRHIYFAQRMAV